MEEDFYEGIKFVGSERKERFGELSNNSSQEGSKHDFDKWSQKSYIIPLGNVFTEKHIEEKDIDDAPYGERNRQREDIKIRQQKRNTTDMDGFTDERYIQRRLGILKSKESASKKWNQTLSEQTESEVFQNLKSENGVFPVKVTGSQDDTHKLGSKNNKRDGKRYYKEQNASSSTSQCIEKCLVLFLGGIEREGWKHC